MHVIVRLPSCASKACLNCEEFMVLDLKRVAKVVGIAARCNPSCQNSWRHRYECIYFEYVSQMFVRFVLLD